MTDGDGRFLVHITKPEKKVEDIHVNDEQADGEESAESCDEYISEEQGKKQKPAEVVAMMIYDWLKLHGLTCTLQFLACDSMNSNTGWRADIIAWLEKLLGSKVTWLICQLHTNELGLMEDLLEWTSRSASQDCGQCGKKLQFQASKSWP